MSNNILDEMARQKQNMGYDTFICLDCKFYKGGLVCEKGVFIAFTGANMQGCIYYAGCRKCPHCGRNH